MSKQVSGKSGEQKKINGDLLCLTYGALVAQLVKDCPSDEDVNKTLLKMGYSIGVRIIDDHFARTGARRCNDLQEVADGLAKVAFKNYLGVSASVANWNTAGDEFSLMLETNPLTRFVELPEDHRSLSFSSIICGAIKGALEQIQLEVSCVVLQDHLLGDPITEIRIKLIRKLDDIAPPGDD